MPTKTTRVNTTLTLEQKKALDKLTEATGAPLTWLIQQAVNEYIQRRAKELK
jgi:predicted transcriptional regulator